MSSPEGPCFFSLSQGNQLYDMEGRINRASFPEDTTKPTAADLAAAGEQIKLCDRTGCELNVGTFMKIGAITRGTGDQIAALDAEISILLPADCSRFRPQPD